eukprot:1157624-Pelagomonas_calceolata.AAC.12
MPAFLWGSQSTEVRDRGVSVPSLCIGEAIRCCCCTSATSRAENGEALVRGWAAVSADGLACCFAAAAAAVVVPGVRVPSWLRGQHQGPRLPRAADACVERKGTCPSRMPSRNVRGRGMCSGECVRELERVGVWEGVGLLLS